MKFPATQFELEKAGYLLQSKSHCLGRNCDALIFWYKTPAGKFMPLSQKADEPGVLLQPHWIDCKNAKDFRQEKRA